MALNETERAAAAAIVNGWLWQPAEGHNYRYRYATRTLTRFCEAASLQPDEMRLVIEFLKDQEIGDGGISLMNRTVDLGTGWKAKDAWYQTMPGERWGNTESTKVRIYQILFLAPADAKEGDGPYLVENGCQYRVSHTFYWDVEALPSVPASASGVAYALQGVTRDRETGLFSCVIEKRERVQQDIAEYVSSETSFATTKDEQHLGVKADRVAATGKAASVSNGAMVRRRVSKNADCTSDVQNETVTEKAVAGASETVSVSLTGTAKRTVNRSMAAKAATSGLDVGESVTNEQTEGGRWTQTIVRLVRNALLRISESCRKTLFEHVHATVDVQTEKPDFDHVSEAGGGVTVEKTVARTEDGSYRVTEQATEEKGVANAVVTARKTLRGTTVTTLDRNQASAASTDKLAVGDEVQVEKTPGGLYNNRVTRAGADAAGEIAASCEKSGDVTHVDTAVTNATAADAALGTHVTASANVVTRRTARVQENGTVDVETVTETHIPKTTGEMSAGSANAAVTVTAGINQVDVPSPGAGAQNVVKRVSATPNGHGSFTTNETTETYTPATAKHETKWATETASTTVTRHDTETEKTVSGDYGETSATPDDNGAATTSVTTYTPNEVDSGWIEWTSEVKTPSGTSTYKHGIRIFCNKEKVPKPESGTDCSVNARINKFGLYDGSLSYSTLTGWTRDTGAGAVGGSVGGTATLDQYKHDALGRTWKRTVTVATRTYYGSGNDGAEASDQANERHVAGLTLKGRTYAVGSPSEGAWTLQA